MKTAVLAFLSLFTAPALAADLPLEQFLKQIEGVYEQPKEAALCPERIDVKVADYTVKIESTRGESWSFIDINHGTQSHPDEIGVDKQRSRYNAKRAFVKYEEAQCFNPFEAIFFGVGLGCQWDTFRTMELTATEFKINVYVRVEDPGYTHWVKQDCSYPRKSL